MHRAVITRRAAAPALFAVGACLAAWMYGDGEVELLRRWASLPPRDGLDAILARAPRLARTAGAIRLGEAAARRRPVLWGHSFVREWSALRKWRDASALAARIPWVVARVQQRDAAEFMLTAQNRGGSAPLLRAAPTWERWNFERRNTSIQKLLAVGDEHHYYNGDFGKETTSQWAADELLAELEPRGELYLRDAPPLTADEAAVAGEWPPENRTSLRLWFTSDGVISRTHYDKAHNCLAQIVGTKQIVLWPPAALPALHLYPAIHVAYRQSQLSLPTMPRGAVPEQGHERDGAAGRYELLDAPSLLGPSGGALRVDLSAGNLLYIPPYWAHAVRSTTPSVALAAFSTSWEQARWARSGWRQAPLGRFSSSPCSKARGASLLTSAFLQALLPRLVGEDLPQRLPRSPRAFLARLWASRYAPLYGPLHADAPDSRGSDGRAAASLADCVNAPPEPSAPERDAALRGRLVDFGGSIAALLTEPDAAWGGRAFGHGEAAELAADYVEELAGWACGADGAWRLLWHLARTEDAFMDALLGGSGAGAAP